MKLRSRKVFSHETCNAGSKSGKNKARNDLISPECNRDECVDKGTRTSRKTCRNNRNKRVSDCGTSKITECGTQKHHSFGTEICLT